MDERCWMFGSTTWEETLETASTIGDGDCGLTDGSEPGDWKVANINELHSLLDYGNNSPSLPADHPLHWHKHDDSLLVIDNRRFRFNTSLHIRFREW